MELIRGYKTELDVNNRQRTLCLQPAGCARVAYNWGLARKRETLAARRAAADPKAVKIPTAMDLHKDLNALKATEYPWMYQSSKCAPQAALRNLDTAFANFFTRRAKYPQFKKKGKAHESFYLANDKFTLGAHWVQIPVLGDFILKQREADGTQIERIKNRTKYKRKLSRVNMAESLHFRIAPPAGTDMKTGKRRHARKQVWCQQVQIVGATVSHTAGHWYISIHVKLLKPGVNNSKPIVGVDVGIKESAVASSGRRFENQRPLAKQITKLQRLGRHLSKKQYDPQTKTSSHNREKARIKLARLHDEIACIREDAHHKLTTELAKTCSVVGIEDVHITCGADVRPKRES